MSVSRVNVSYFHVRFHNVHQLHNLRALRMNSESGSADMAAMDDTLPHPETEADNSTPRDLYSVEEIIVSENTVLF